MTDDELFADDIPHPADAASPDALADPFGGNGPSPFADGLNPDQLDAVVHRGGPAAGGGRCRFGQDPGAHPSHRPPDRTRACAPRSSAITFTNKAADEMKHRVAALVGPVVKAMWVCTFHSACVRILRANADVLGYPRTFSIYDQADAQRLAGYVVRDLGLDAKRFPPRGVHGQISLWKNELVTPAQATAKAGNIFERKHAEVYTEYQARLLKAGAMDFDDLLMKTVELFRHHPEVLAHYQQRFKHVLIDEYQDTNTAQNEIALLLAAGHQQITIVGDGDQCLPPGTLVHTPERSGAHRGDRGRRRRHRHRRPPNVVEPGVVRHVQPGSYRGPVVRGRPAMSSLTGTPHHLVPATFTVPAGKHLVYLMHRGDRGYRIGRTKSVRSNSNGYIDAGFRVRSIQEHADALWVLRVCDSLRRGGLLRGALRRRLRPAHGVLPLARAATLAMDDQWLATPVRRNRHRHGGQSPDGRVARPSDFPHHRPQNGGCAAP